MLNIAYKAIIQPHIGYCITVWGYAPDVHIDKIQRMQCRAACLVHGIFDCMECTRGWYYWAVRVAN